MTLALDLELGSSVDRWAAFMVARNDHCNSTALHKPVLI